MNPRYETYRCSRTTSCHSGNTNPRRFHLLVGRAKKKWRLTSANFSPTGFPLVSLRKNWVSLLARSLKVCLSAAGVQSIKIEPSCRSSKKMTIDVGKFFANWLSTSFFKKELWVSLLTRSLKVCLSAAGVQSIKNRTWRSNQPRCCFQLCKSLLISFSAGPGSIIARAVISPGKHDYTIMDSIEKWLQWIEFDLFERSFVVFHQVSGYSKTYRQDIDLYSSEMLGEAIILHVSFAFLGLYI